MITAVPSAATSASGKAQAREIGDVLEAGIGEVAAGDLPGALQQVADDRAAPEPGPVLHRPAELVDLRRQEHRRIGRAAGDDDVGAARQRFHDGPGAEVGVGRDELVAERADRLAGLFEQVVATSHHLQHVVAGDGGDLDPAEAQRAGDLLDLLGGGERVGSTHVGDDPDALGAAGGQDRLHPLDEQGIVALRGIFQLRLLGERDGALGQAFEDQVIELALLGQLDRRLDPIAGEAGAGPDPDRFHRVAPFQDR